MCLEGSGKRPRNSPERGLVFGKAKGKKKLSERKATRHKTLLLWFERKEEETQRRRSGEENKRKERRMTFLTCASRPSRWRTSPKDICTQIKKQGERTNETIFFFFFFSSWFCLLLSIYLHRSISASTSVYLSTYRYLSVCPCLSNTDLALLQVVGRSIDVRVNVFEQEEEESKEICLSRVWFRSLTLSLSACVGMSLPSCWIACSPVSRFLEEGRVIFSSIKDLSFFSRESIDHCQRSRERRRAEKEGR